MDYRMFKIYNQTDFDKITHGIKVAQCMRSKSSMVPDSLPDIQQLEELTISDSLCCSFCNTIFENQAQQRLHYKLDWHRYNLKQRLRGFKSIAESEFDILLDKDDVSSISGVESDSDDEYDTGSNETSGPSGGTPKSEGDKLKNGVGKSKSSVQKIRLAELMSDSSDTDDEETNEKRRMELRLAVASRHSKVFFENASGDIFSIYRCLLHNKKEIPEIDDEMIAQAIESGKKSSWTIVMVGGGHFAAAVFQGAEAIAHKTFHAYTVRAKQGSSQSSRDSRCANGHSKSAGASLRRYNEMKLLQHVQELLDSWSTHISGSSLILYRAVGPQNRTILFGGKNPPFDKNDPRLRPLPFPTRRATFNEIKRVHDILSTMEIYGQATDFTESFPVTPRQPIRKKMPKLDEDNEGEMNSPSKENIVDNSPASSSDISNAKGTPTKDQATAERHRCNKPNIDRAKSRKSPNRPLPEIITLLAKSSSESEMDAMIVSNNILLDFPMIDDDCTIDLHDQLIEFDEVGGKSPRLKKIRGLRKKSNKSNRPKVPPNDALSSAKLKLWTACRIGDVEMVSCTWESLMNEIRRCEEVEKEQNPADTNCPAALKMADVLRVINEVDEDGNTMLHLAAINNHLQILWLLLEIGINPCKKNKKCQTAYIATTKKEARNTFRKFMAMNPNKFDYNESQIPALLTKEVTPEELEKKKYQRKVKREREKMKKKEFELKKKEEEAKQRFLNLSDREKRALEAEKRFQRDNTMISRCFQCGTDITGIIAFEYNTNRFCSMPCLKEHRLHNKFVL